MKFTRVVLCVALAISASAAAAATNWLTVVDPAGGGHLIGNPNAKVKLTEFVSYTCPHCGQFAEAGSSAVEVYVATGKIKLDVRHVVRDPVDLTAAMIANCGPAEKFPRNHAALMLSQPKWLPIMLKATAGQKARWYNGDQAARRRAIASDLDFYDVMAGRGYDRTTIDHCLSDAALAKRLADQTVADDKKWNLPGTPTFAINDNILTGVYTWGLLRPFLDAQL